MRQTAPLAILLLMSAQMAATLLYLPRLEFHADLSVESDQDPRIQESLERERDFPSPNPLLLLVPQDGALYSDATLNRLADVLKSLGTAGLPSRSIASVRIGEDSDQGRVSRLLWTPGQPGALLEADLNTHPVYKELFLNPAETAWIVYLPTMEDGQAEAGIVQELLPRWRGVVPGGAPWVRFLLDGALKTNLTWLMPGAFLLLWAVFVFLTRGVGSGLGLVILSFQPAIGVLLIFPVFGWAFDFTTILAPLLVLALATTYTVHIYHHLGTFGPGWTDLFRQRGRAVFWSALISALGFSSLVFSPLPSLRVLGFLLATGLALTLFWCLIGLPFLFRILPKTSHRQTTLPIAPPRRWMGFALGLVVILAVPGSLVLRTAFHWSDYLSADSAESKHLRQFENLFPAWQEANLHLAWSQEGAWVDTPRWKALAALVSRWKEENPGTRVWTVQDAVSGVLSELGMDSDSTNAEDLGQALEFLPSIQETGKLINGAQSELVVRWAFSGNLVQDRERGIALEKILGDAQQAFPGATVRWSGPLYRQILGLQAFLQGELWGLLAFFVVTWGIIAVKLRSWRRGTLAMLPSLVSAGVFLGIAGWLQWPISPATALVVAACIGQTTDDGLLWSLLPPTAEVRSSLAESTLLLSSALLVLGFSTFSNIAEAGFLVILSLCISTAMVLWFLPWRTSP